MTYNIISTGSQGNAVVIDGSILVDCGVPFKALADVKKDLKLVLLTHQHGDHFRSRTVRALAKARPALRWGCCDWMVPHLLEAGVDKRRIDVLSPWTTYDYSFAAVRPEPLVHNVPNCGYHIQIGPERLFYATDTGTLDGIQAKDYDLYLIEANHIQAELEQRLDEKRAAGEFAYEYAAAQNHLSKEQAMDWLAENIGPNSRVQFLHQHSEKEHSNAE